jgi:hypothetical protein
VGRRGPEGGRPPSGRGDRLRRDRGRGLGPGEVRGSAAGGGSRERTTWATWSCDPGRCCAVAWWTRTAHRWPTRA